MESGRQEWLFASGVTLEECFGEELLSGANASSIQRVVMEKLQSIREQPVTPNAVIVGGEPVHVVRTGRFAINEETLPPLLIVYYLDHVRHLVHLMLVCSASSVENEPIERTLQHAMSQRRRDGR